MVRFFDRIRFILAWDRALQLASKKKHREALAIIEALPEEVSSGLFWSILRLQQFRELGNNIFAIDLARSLTPRIEASDALGSSEKKYLLAYVKWMLGSSSARLFDTEDSLVPSACEVDWREISLSEVPAHVKRYFPLRPH